MRQPQWPLGLVLAALGAGAALWLIWVLLAPLLASLAALLTPMK
jgi:hypothetical protein